MQVKKRGNAVNRQSGVQCNLSFQVSS